MSLVLFANLGLVPGSQAPSGMLLKVSINGVFVGAGSLMALIAGGMLRTPDLKLIGQRIAGVENYLKKKNVSSQTAVKLLYS
jgi:hypothetical protein